ncbi:hypothetical protein KUCAC02_015594, partial [Chaenocephalus aceratus]
DAVPPTEAIAVPLTEAITVPLTEAIAVPLTEAIAVPLTEALSYSATLNYVLDTARPGSEILVKEGHTCITREEFWSLGLGRNMDAHVSTDWNACMKWIHEAARQHGKDIYIEDMYIVPTWKNRQSNMVANFPKSCSAD